MNLKIGIVGLPNVGKSTLFRAITRKEVPIDNYPFVTIEPNVGVVAVPDERLDRLALLSRSAKKIPAIVEFVDIAGLVKGAAEGEGLGNTFLTHIREVDAIAHVVRVFLDADIIHVGGAVDPTGDIGIIDVELMLKDAETVLRRLETNAKRIRAGDKAAVAEQGRLEALRAGLAQGKLARDILAGDRGGRGEALQRELGLLTAKRRIFVLNASEEQITEQWEPDAALRNAFAGDPHVALSAKMEDELQTLSADERREYLASVGGAESGLDRLIRLAYETLGLITFFTTGEDETRAWTIPRGSAAPRAGRAVHSDFEGKFIRAEVIAYRKLVEAGSYARARELGWVRTEGKDYVVQDGDVVEFRI